MNASSDNAQTRKGKSIKPALATIRHNDLIGLFVSQHTKFAQSPFYRLMSSMVFKPLNMTQVGEERGHLRRQIRYWKELMPRDPTQTFILSKHIPPLRIARAAPVWYTDAISTSYSKLETWADALAIATKKRRKGDSWEVIETAMAVRWQEYIAANRWRDKVLAANGGIDPKTGRAPRKKGEPDQV